jgi:hypothetical protein
MKKNQIITNNKYTEFLLYTTPNGNVKLEIFLHNENIWLTQEKIALLFGVQRPAITKHLKNIFESRELLKDSVCSILEHTALDGKKYKTKYYNLDAIISVGYRVNSIQATQFRIWATEKLKDYIIKGYCMDDDRLKNPNNIFGKDYFEEQLARIRDIRSSERRFYQKITDIYSQCSADYDKDCEITKTFFATIQNKLHWAISNQTAAEIIFSRANWKKENMGLKNWKNAPVGKIRKFDVSIAKNYLDENELTQLNRIVSMYLDYAELQVNNRKIMTMKDWAEKLDGFLKFNEKEILTNPGKITAEIAKIFAEEQYEKYRVIQDQIFESDFDKHIGKILELNRTKKIRNKAL